jgi:hypothetical protein
MTLLQDDKVGKIFQLIRLQQLHFKILGDPWILGRVNIAFVVNPFKLMVLKQNRHHCGSQVYCISTLVYQSRRERIIFIQTNLLPVPTPT